MHANGAAMSSLLCKLRSINSVNQVKHSFRLLNGGQIRAGHSEQAATTTTHTCSREATRRIAASCNLHIGSLLLPKRNTIIRGSSLRIVSSTAMEVFSCVTACAICVDIVRTASREQIICRANTKTPRGNRKHRVETGARR
jgi:hypothetical protein